MIPPMVGRTARVLGFAGLLPALASVGGMAVLRTTEHGLGPLDAPLITLAFAYPLLILSFLGGIWWGFAMRRETRQAWLAQLAVAPSLVALTLLAMLGLTGRPDWTLVAIGCAVMLTLLVDRHLVTTGEAPANWMRLRVPLSLGLGGLTILAGALVSY